MKAWTEQTWDGFWWGFWIGGLAALGLVVVLYQVFTRI